MTLTRELAMGPRERFPYFAGEFDGTPIRYHCIAVEFVAPIRRGLAECGAVIHDAPSVWLDLSTPADLPAQETPAKVPDRAPVPAGSIGSTALAAALERDLDALNETARKELDRSHPEPADCPSAGSWVRAAYVDDDLRYDPSGLWHLVVGWRGDWGSLRLRCASRNRTVNCAMNPDLRGSVLLRSAERPADAVCQRCTRLTT